VSFCGEISHYGNKMFWKIWKNESIENLEFLVDFKSPTHNLAAMRVAEKGYHNKL